MCFQVGVVLLNFLKNAVFQHIITNKSPFTFNVILHQKSEKEEKLKRFLCIASVNMASSLDLG